MDEMKGQAEAVGTEMIQDHINKVDLSKSTPFEAMGDSGQKSTLLIVLLFLLVLKQDG